jgi:hypothetical protein
MTDVVEIAKERRVRLANEIAKLDEFILMAERLVKYTPLKSNKASDTEGARDARSAGPRPLGSYSDDSGEEAKG